MLKDLDDDYEVLIPVNNELGCSFKTPCDEISGVTEIFFSQNEGKIEDGIEVFLLLPSDFFEEGEEDKDDENFSLN